MKRLEIGLNPTRTPENNQNIDNSEKIANMVASSKVQSLIEYAFNPIPLDYPTILIYGM